MSVEEGVLSFSQTPYRSNAKAPRLSLRRRWTSRLACGALVFCAAIALVPLIGIFGYVVAQGAGAIRWSFFTELPRPVGELGGGMANALAGTLLLILIASGIGVPWGLAVGIQLAASRAGVGARLARFSAEMLASVPSIVIGLFAYAVVVIPMKRFSAFAGGVALSLIVVPVVARTTEEALRLVPEQVREAGLALGLPQWRVTLQILLRAARPGILTGVLLALARAGGETAPLLFTALGSHFWSLALDQPIASLPVQIYTYAVSPFGDWHQQAWAGALLLVMTLFLANLLTRLALSRSSP